MCRRQLALNRGITASSLSFEQLADVERISRSYARGRRGRDSWSLWDLLRLLPLTVIAQ